MAQNQPPFWIAQLPNKILSSLGLDAVGLLLTTRGGATPKYNLGAAAVIKAAPGRVGKVVIIAPGSTSGAFTLNDCTTTGAAAASNEIWTLPYNGSANLAGTVFDLDWPCQTGLVLSAVPGGGTPIVAVSYT